MKILITGANGMLGREAQAIYSQAGHEILPTDIVSTDHILDITQTSQTISLLGEYRPDAVLHCAAWTNVDGAESHKLEAYRINALGTWNLAYACSLTGIPICAISTDFVFDGEKSEPYTEFDTPNPLSVYGKSKLAGEMRLRDIWSKHWIVRTSWLYGVHGKCFPDTIIKAAAKWEPGAPPLRIVADQCGSPTWTRDLAAFTLLLIERSLPWGTWHFSNQGETNWHEFARTALNLSGLGSVPTIPISSTDWRSPAPRPRKSTLHPLSIEMLNLPSPPDWKDSLSSYLKERSDKIGKG